MLPWTHKYASALASRCDSVWNMDERTIGARKGNRQSADAQVRSALPGVLAFRATPEQRAEAWVQRRVSRQSFGGPGAQKVAWKQGRGKSEVDAGRRMAKA